MSVLIVDDHPSCRAAVRAMLEAEGFPVVGEAQDGASALTTARELQPSLVILDVQLPDTDGFAVASELTRDGGGPRVVLMSSRDASDYGPLIAQSGALGFVPKCELCVERITALLQ